jgi:hypothetical protein
LKEVAEGEMNRHLVFLIGWMTATALSLCLFLSEPYAREEEPVVISGRLTGYDARSVDVDGEKVELCENARVLDPAEMDILTDGLVATERVKVIIINGCAMEVKAMEIRR